MKLKSSALGISKKAILPIIILIVIYVLLGNARSVQENPFLDGTPIPINMIVPVLAGIIFGPFSGFVVGIIGTFINALTPAGSLMEFAAIVPHGIMGLIAGLAAIRFPRFVAAVSIIAGQLLNLVMFLIFGLLTIPEISLVDFWLALGYTAFLNIISVIVINSVYSLTFIRREEVKTYGTEH